MTPSHESLSAATRSLARFSETCPVCRCARRRQAGLAFWVVKTFENLCPCCRAYEKVHGRKSHEPQVPPSPPSTQ
jgi:hypothetical protein